MKTETPSLLTVYSRTTKKAIFCVLSFLLCTACITEESIPSGNREGTRIQVGDSLPRFSVTTADGRSLSRDSLLGNLSVVVFFHTQCGDCQKELPRVDSLYRHFSDKENFRLICIAREEDQKSIARFWKEKNLAMPYSPQADHSVFSLFAYTNVPRIYISSPDGVVRYLHDDKTMPTFSLLRKQVLSLE